LASNRRNKINRAQQMGIAEMMKGGAADSGDVCHETNISCVMLYRLVSSSGEVRLAS